VVLVCEYACVCFAGEEGGEGGGGGWGGWCEKGVHAGGALFFWFIFVSSACAGHVCDMCATYLMCDTFLG